ncbi:MAG TPA: urate oxidase [Candidatus Dormibacteraeota bacterium]|nr:urate oxidase [Candidatus Dormibacteraeota bacterium]
MADGRDANTDYELGENRYGKSRIRLVTVRRGPERHDLRDLTVAIALEGDFAAVHVDGDNANLVATDTMKNTVYAFARDRLTGSPEAFGLELARHFATHPLVDRAMVDIEEHRWLRIPIESGGEAPDAFTRAGDLTRLVRVTVGPDGAVDVEAGVGDLTVMKTTKSAFSGFDRDAYTTLPEVDDRLMATKLRATWGLRTEVAASDSFDFDAAWDRARVALRQSLAEHFSPSVQASIWIMATAMMDAEPSIEWVRMVLPNLHHWKVDLAPFGLDNPGEVFVSTTEPHGLIDATVRRRAAG